MPTDGTINTLTEVTYSSVRSVLWSWTAGADGGVSGWWTTNTFEGEVCVVGTTPGGVPYVPTSYTVQILDADGFDILIGSGVGRSTTVTEYLYKPGGATSTSKLQLVISGAGAGTKGTVKVCIR